MITDSRESFLLNTQPQKGFERTNRKGRCEVEKGSSSETVKGTALLSNTQNCEEINFG